MPDEIANGTYDEPEDENPDAEIKVILEQLAAANSARESAEADATALRAEVEQQKGKIAFITAERDGADETIKSLRAFADVRYAEMERLTVALKRNRQGYRNILEFRKLDSGRYGALTREEIEESITEIDAALSPAKPEVAS